MLGESFDLDGTALPAIAIIGGIKAAFINHAREDLGLTETEE